MNRIDFRGGCHCDDSDEERRKREGKEEGDETEKRVTLKLPQ